MYSSSLDWNLSPAEITIPVPGNELPFMNTRTAKIVSDALEAPYKAFDKLVQDKKLFCPYCHIIPTYDKGACCGMCMLTRGVSHTPECLKIHHKYFMPVMAVQSPIYTNAFSTIKEPMMPPNTIVSVSPTNHASVISPYAVPIMYGGDDEKWKQKYLKYKKKYLELKNK